MGVNYHFIHVHVHVHADIPVHVAIELFCSLNFMLWRIQTCTLSCSIHINDLGRHVLPNGHVRELGATSLAQIELENVHVHVHVVYLQWMT